jgi:hypothetical protein
VCLVVLTLLPWSSHIFFICLFVFHSYAGSLIMASINGLDSDLLHVNAARTVGLQFMLRLMQDGPATVQIDLLPSSSLLSECRDNQLTIFVYILGGLLEVASILQSSSSHRVT